MDELFEKNGFVKLKESDKKLLIHIFDNKGFIDNYYDFNFETNVINKIPNTDIEFAIAINNNGRKCFFINQGFNPFHGENITSPYRTFYNGLMKEPFKHVYPLDETIKIETESNLILEIKVDNV